MHKYDNTLPVKFPLSTVVWLFLVELKTVIIAVFEVVGDAVGLVGSVMFSASTSQGLPKSIICKQETS